MQVYQETDQATTQQDENPVPFIGARGFTQVENTVIYNRDLSVGARHTYTVLTAHMYNKDHCWPGMARLAHILGVTEKTARGYILGVTEKTARGYIRELEDAGLIHKRRQGQGYTNVYTRKAASLNHESKPVNTTDQEKHISTGLDQALTTAKEDEVEEKKYKNPPEGANAPQAGESKDKDQVPSKTSTLSANSENQQPAAKRLMSKLVKALDAQGAFLDEEQRDKYGANFKALINKGVDPGELDKTVDRIVERWPSGHQLSPQRALGDVRDGRGATKGDPTPPAGIEALRTYRHYKSGRIDLRKYADLAEQFDFTSDEEPPPRVFRQLGGATPDTWGKVADQERQDNLERIRRVTRLGVEEAQESAIRRIRAMGLESSGESPEEAESPLYRSEPVENWSGDGGKLIPVGVSEEGEKVAEVLQDAGQDAGRVFRQFLGGRLNLETAIDAACYAVWGGFEPPEGHAVTVRRVVEGLANMLRDEEVSA